MLLAAAFAISAHFVDWSAPGLIVAQKGIAVGTPRVSERLILFFKTGDCRDGMQVKSGRYGDYEKAEQVLLASHICDAR